MKVALFSDAFRLDLGGTSKTVVDLANGLTKQGHKVMVVSNNNDPLLKEFRVYTTPSLPVLGKRMNAQFPTRAILNRIREFDPDIIHFHNPFTAAWNAIVTAERLNKPVVGSLHVLLDEFISVYLPRRFPLNRRLESFARNYLSFIYNRADCVVLPSQYTLDKLGPLFKTRVVKINLGVDIGRFRNAEPAYTPWPFVFLYLGRLSKEKNVRFIIDAFDKLRNREAALLIAGDGPERRKLQRYASKLDARNRIRFIGRVPHGKVQSVYHSADVFLFTSKTETFSLVLLEAQASGLPVVSFNQPPINENLANGKNAVLCTPNDLDNFAGAMESMIKSPSKLKRMSTAALENAQRFDFRDFITIHINLYEEIIDEKRHSHS